MALDKDRLGNAIVDKLEALFGEAVTAASDATLRQMWKAVAEAIIEEIDVHLDIVLQQGDISILPGTFKDSLTNPITGAGVNDAVTLSGKAE